MSTVVENAAVVEKEVRIALPVIAVEDYKTLAVTTAEVPGAEAAFLNISDINEYAQFAAVAKTCSNVKIYGNGKGCSVVIDGSHPKNTEKVAQLNAELAGKVVIAVITYNGAERLRLSAKTMGTSKAKKSVRGSFFDNDLTGLVDMGAHFYIYGKEGTEFTKELNTKICRVVKALVPFGLLYSDEDKSGFHKAKTRIPSDARTKDNYGWYFEWAEIAAKLDAGIVLGKLEAHFVEAAKAAKAKTLEAGVEVNLDDAELAVAKAEAAKTATELNINSADVIANIVKIINDVYPTITIDTTKTLYIEALVSEFARIKSERFVFDATAGKIVSKKEEEAEAKAAKAAKKAEEKEAKDAAKKAKKAEAAANETPEVAVEAPVVAVDAPVEVTVAMVAPVEVAAVTPIAPVAPITPIAPVGGINAATLLGGIAPSIN